MIKEVIINEKLYEYTRYHTMKDLKGNEIETYELLDGSYLTIWNNDDEVDNTGQSV